MTKVSRCAWKQSSPVNLRRRAGYARIIGVVKLVMAFKVLLNDGSHGQEQAGRKLEADQEHEGREAVGTVGLLHRVECFMDRKVKDSAHVEKGNDESEFAKDAMGLLEAKAQEVDLNGEDSQPKEREHSVNVQWLVITVELATRRTVPSKSLALGRRFHEAMDRRLGIRKNTDQDGHLRESYRVVSAFMMGRQHGDGWWRAKVPMKSMRLVAIVWFS